MKAGAGAAAAGRSAGGAQPSAGHADAQVRKLFDEGSYEVVPHDSMRKIIARRLVEAKSTIPHFYLTIDCRIDKLLALRTDINAAAPVTKGEKGDVPAYKVSVNDMVIKALAMALMRRAGRQRHLDRRRRCSSTSRWMSASPSPFRAG